MDNNRFPPLGGTYLIILPTLKLTSPVLLLTPGTIWWDYRDLLSKNDVPHVDHVMIHSFFGPEVRDEASRLAQSAGAELHTFTELKHLENWAARMARDYDALFHDQVLENEMENTFYFRVLWGKPWDRKILFIGFPPEEFQPWVNHRQIVWWSREYAEEAGLGLRIPKGVTAIIVMNTVPHELVKLLRHIAGEVTMPRDNIRVTGNIALLKEWLEAIFGGGNGKPKCMAVPITLNNGEKIAVIGAHLPEVPERFVYDRSRFAFLSGEDIRSGKAIPRHIGVVIYNNEAADLFKPMKASFFYRRARMRVTERNTAAIVSTLELVRLIGQEHSLPSASLYQKNWIDGEIDADSVAAGRRRDAECKNNGHCTAAAPIAAEARQPNGAEQTLAGSNNASLQTAEQEVASLDIEPSVSGGSRKGCDNDQYEKEEGSMARKKTLPPVTGQAKLVLDNMETTGNDTGMLVDILRANGYPDAKEKTVTLARHQLRKLDYPIPHAKRGRSARIADLPDAEAPDSMRQQDAESDKQVHNQKAAKAPKTDVSFQPAAEAQNAEAPDTAAAASNAGASNYKAPPGSDLAGIFRTWLAQGEKIATMVEQVLAEKRQLKASLARVSEKFSALAEDLKIQD